MIKRNALNRGTAIHIRGARIRLIWPCGCSQTQTMKSPTGVLCEEAVKLLVKNWRANGVTLPQCKNHPDYYNPNSQLERLNRENPG